jgi:phospholipase C
MKCESFIAVAMSLIFIVLSLVSLVGCGGGNSSSSSSRVPNTEWASGPTYTAPPYFSHIIFIIQENRTPDTLFGGAPYMSNPPCAGWNGFAPGIDLQNGGPNKFVSPTTCSPLTSYPNLNFGGGNHSHTDWEAQYDAGNLDGACTNGTAANCAAGDNPPYGPYIAVQQSVAQPYFSIASKYGWANYMFQTNQGPSFPAHQFLFSGTSAPTWPGDQYSEYFVAENPGLTTSGCDAVSTTTGKPLPAPHLDWIDPTGTETTVIDLFPSPTSFLEDGYQCYDHNTLVTAADSQANTSSVSDRPDKAGAPISWRYYSQQAGIIWNAPEAVTQTCYSQNAIVPNAAGTAPAECGPNAVTAADEYSHVSFPVPNGTGAPILTDIQSCDLQQISWVTPDEVWSDHPGLDPNNLGPSWVAVIVNAVGQSANPGNSVNPATGRNCDYWGNNPNDTASTSIEPTAIFIVWDDWGGFYDHVPPPAVNVGLGTPPSSFTCTNSQGGNWGCGYTYGFRVPMLVVSPYTKPGTISGALSSNIVPTLAQYANLPKAWVHDFGSLLNFTEQNFYPAGTRIAPDGFTYADSNTFDTSYQGQTVVPLWEFFTSPTQLPFTPITPATNPATGLPYTASFFEHYYDTQSDTGVVHKPTGPDNDGDED